MNGSYGLWITQRGQIIHHPGTGDGMERARARAKLHPMFKCHVQHTWDLPFVMDVHQGHHPLDSKP